MFLLARIKIESDITFNSITVGKVFQVFVEIQIAGNNDEIVHVDHH